MKNFKDKVVVITGAANGLGKAVAVEFFTRGSHLALIDRDADGLKSLKERLQTGEQLITIHPADVSDEQKIIKARLEILDAHHRIDILINNAGISISQAFEQIELSDFRKLFEVNFWGTVLCSRHFLDDLKLQDDSRLVNIISNFAMMGFPGKSAYGSSKSAVLGLTNALKAELAGTSVKVCLVIPPPLNTGLVRNSRHIDEKKKEREVQFITRMALPLDSTARRIIRQIGKGKYRILVGKKTYLLDWAARLFPSILHKAIGKRKKKIDFF